MTSLSTVCGLRSRRCGRRWRQYGVRSGMIDPFEKENLPTDVDARRVRSLEAEELVNEKGVFMLAIKSLARKWYAEMVTSPEKQRMEAAAMKLQVLESI